MNLIHQQIQKLTNMKKFLTRKRNEAAKELKTKEEKVKKLKELSKELGIEIKL